MPPRKPRQPSQDPAAAELEILHPEREFTLAGRTITMREYGFVEGLKLRPLFRAFADDLYAAFDERVTYDAVLDVMSRHADAVVELAAAAADLDPEWVRALSPADGETLLMFWWGVNSGFFTRSLVSRRLVEAEEQRQVSQRAGAKSTPP